MGRDSRGSPLSAREVLERVPGERLLVRVRPRAPRTEVLGWDEARGALHLAVAAPPEEGKANREIERFLSRWLGRRVEIASGAGSRLKQLRLGPARRLTAS